MADLPEDVRAQMKALLDEAFVRAGEVLASNRPTFDRLVDFIMEKGTATGKQLVAVWKGEDPSAVDPDDPTADAASEGEPAEEPSDAASEGEPAAVPVDEEKEDAR